MHRTFSAEHPLYQAITSSETNLSKGLNYSRPVTEVASLNVIRKYFDYISFNMITRIALQVGQPLSNVLLWAVKKYSLCLQKKKKKLNVF